MNTLLIIANPSKSSFSHALAESYATRVRKSGNQAYLLDLYELGQEFLEYESMDALKLGNYNGGEKQRQVQKLLSEYDEYAFFFPVWWGAMPAILKNFFDINFSSGFAFRFVPGKALPDKLLIGKSAKIFYHSDAPSLLYRVPFLSGIHLRSYISRTILGFCGVKVTGGMSIGNLRKKTEKQKQDILQSLQK